MTKRRMIFIITCICILAVVIGVFAYRRAVTYSQKVIQAISESNYEAAEQAIQSCPWCVNTAPTFCPEWLRLLFELPAARYPLQEACKKMEYDIAVLLIENGADCNLAGQIRIMTESRTPLIEAVLFQPMFDDNGPYYRQEDRYSLVSLLLEKGADKTFTDLHNNTPYDYAVLRCDTELCKLLWDESYQQSEPAIRRTFSVLHYETHYRQFWEDIPDGYCTSPITDANAAVRAAEQIWRDIYAAAAEHSCESVVYYSDTDDAWLVVGNPMGWDAMGNIPYVIIQSDGTVTAVWHSR